MFSFTVVVTVQEISTVTSTEIWTFLEDDVRCSLVQQWIHAHASVYIPSGSQLFGVCPPGVQVNLVFWGDDFDAHAWSFNGYTLIRQSVEVVVSHVPRI